MLTYLRIYPSFGEDPCEVETSLDKEQRLACNICAGTNVEDFDPIRSRRASNTRFRRCHRSAVLASAHEKWNSIGKVRSRRRL
jgi:hypothetical protein